MHLFSVEYSKIYPENPVGSYSYSTKDPIKACNITMRDVTKNDINNIIIQLTNIKETL